MSPELRKRMKEVASQDPEPEYRFAFGCGAHWMHQEEVVPREELLAEIENALHMFAAETISSLIVSQSSFNKLWELRLKIQQLQKGGEG